MRSRPSAAAARATAVRSTAWRRPAAVAAILVVLTNGPVFLLAKSVLDRPGHWEDWAVWPFFAAAATASAVLAAAEHRRRGRSPAEGDTAAVPVTDHRGRGRSPEGAAQWVGTAAVAWFSVLAVASSAWSVDGSDTAWRSFVYLGLALLAWVISGLDCEDLCSVLAIVSGFAVATSLVLVVLRPDLGVDDNGRWQGVYTNPNSLAPLAALGVLVGIRYLASGWSARMASAGSARRASVGAPRRTSAGSAHRASAGRGSRLAGGALAALSLVAMAGAGSRTAWLALAVAATVAGLPSAHLWQRERWGRSSAGLVTAVVAAVGLAAACTVLAASWNVATFAQRRTMWRLVWERIEQSPFAGHGFFTFWDIEELTQHVLLRRGSAHNSLMEVGLGLGLLGAVPFLVIVALAVRNAGMHAWRSPGADSWMWAAVVAFLLVENVTESFVLWFSYNWVLLMAAAMRPVPARPALVDAGGGADGDARPAP